MKFAVIAKGVDTAPYLTPIFDGELGNYPVGSLRPDWRALSGLQVKVVCSEDGVAQDAILAYEEHNENNTFWKELVVHPKGMRGWARTMDVVRTIEFNDNDLAELDSQVVGINLYNPKVDATRSDTGRGEVPSLGMALAMLDHNRPYKLVDGKWAINETTISARDNPWFLISCNGSWCALDWMAPVVRIDIVTAVADLERDFVLVGEFGAMTVYRAKSEAEHYVGPEVGALSVDYIAATRRSY